MNLFTKILGNRRNKKSAKSLRHAWCFVHEHLEARTLLAAIPTATLVTTPQSPLIGETATFELGFQNTSPTDTGYGPYLDLTLPAIGADGGDDGITFQSATYLGTPLAATVLTFDASGEVLHPLAKDSAGAPVVVNGTPGDQLVVLALPFGSFTPGQPEAIVQVTTNVSQLADVGTALPFQAQAGFYLGDTPVDDPTNDPSIIGPAVDGTTTPELLRLTKTYLGPENETATGPSYPQQYLVSVEVAKGQTVTNLDLTDVLPSNMQFLSVADTQIDGVSVPTTAISTPSLSTPGGTLTREFTSVTGMGSPNDASMLFNFYIPQLDSSNNPVLAPGVGLPTTSVDQANSQAFWTPLNPSDLAGIYTSNTAVDMLTDKSLAIQKTVDDVNHTGPPNAVSPGDTLEYTIQFQISDFFAVQNFVANDLLSDGQAFDPSFQPTLEVHGNGLEVANSDFAPENVVVTPQSDGSTSVAFLVSDELITRGYNGELLGGMVNPSGGLLPFPGVGPTTGTITFRTVIQKTFTATPSPGAIVGQGDKISDGVTASADVLDNTTLTPSGNSVTDDSQAQTVISAGSLTKTIYAINGSTSVGPNPNVKPGDDVTYRLQYSLPNSNIGGGLILDDYLPLPIFDATSVTTFQAIVSAAAPAVGTAEFGPSDTFYATSGLVPTLSVDAVSNSVSFEWPPYMNNTNANTDIDILFTVEVSSQPFADQLLLTNLAQSTEKTANNSPVIGTSIVQVTLNEPVLNVRKGVVATNDPLAQFTLSPVGPVPFNPPGSLSPAFTAPITSAGLASSPIDANLVQAQGGDLVTFAISIENTGTGPNGAFDVTFSDTMPAGFQIPAGGLNLHVTDGTGTPLQYTVLSGGLFGSGLQLVDPSATMGALTRFSDTSGTNIAIVTYDLQLRPTVMVGSTQINTATLSNYASVPGGPDFLPVDLTDPASVSVKGISVDKALTHTDQTFTTGPSDLAIGEVGTYTVTITVPQGLTTPAARLVDTLPDGLAIVDLVSLTTNSPNNIFCSDGTLPSILATAQASGIGTNGSSVTFAFGNILNTDTDSSQANTITAVYQVVALNVSANTNDRSQTNSAQFFYDNTSTSASTTVKIVVPHMEVTKTVDNPTADAGDIVTYTLTIKHASDTGADAFNVTLSDVVPAGVTYVPGSFVYVSGLAPSSQSEAGTTLSAGYDSFPQGETSVLSFKATVDDNIAAFQTVINTASIQYTTLPGSRSTPISPYNPNSVERTGNPADPGGSANNLNASGSASFTPTPTITKVLIGTDQPFTTGNSVAIGETAQYGVTITIPEGVSPSAIFSDQLPSGLAIVSLDQLVASSSLTTSLAGGFDSVLPNALVQNMGHLLTLNLGTVTNPVINGAAQTITIDYTTVVLNVSANQSGATLTNDATFRAGAGQVETSAPNLNVVTPRLILTKTASPKVADVGGPPITFTLVLSHDVTSTTDAFNVTITDPIPSGLIIVPGSLVNTAGQAPTTLQVNGSVIDATFDEFPLGSTSTIQYQATLAPTTVPGHVFTNTADSEFTSLPGNVLTPISPYNPVSTERTGDPNDPGGAVNDLAAGDQATVTLFSNRLAGTVFVDLNNNGILTSNDPLISGVILTLTGTDYLGNLVFTTTTTDVAGQYAFTGLRPGNYVITETQPAGYLSGINTVGSQGGMAAPPPANVLSEIVLPLGASTNGVGNNFAELLPASIGGTVFCDCNDDGIQQPSETGIPGVTITLTGVDTTGTPVHLVTTTNSQGSYDFSFLNPGTYIITESAPSGYFEGKNTAGTAGGTVSGDVISGITLAVGVDASGYNFADLTPSTISGVVYYDLNHNGVMDSDDFGIAHVTVTLNGTDDLGQSIHMTTVTNNNGVYSFGDLRPGTYDIIRTQPAIFRGYKNTAGSLGGTVNKDSITDISVPACATGVDYLFGELEKPTCSLHGLAISVGNLFYHFERTYQSDPVAFAKQYPNLAPSIAAGQVPWGKAPFPSARVASFWVPTLGTKPIKIFPVKGIKPHPLAAVTPAHSAVLKPAHAQESSFKPVGVHTRSIKPTLLQRIVRK